MNNPPRDFPRPLVPLRYTKQTIDRMPYDEPCYITADYDDVFDAESPVFFVDEEGRLRASRDTEIEDYAFDRKRSPLGRVGIMRTILIGEGSDVRDAYVADLRFLGSHQLDSFSDMVGSIDNQEAYMACAELLETSIRFEGIIVAEEDTKCKSGKIPRGAFYGDEMLHPVLKTLRKFGSSAMATYFKEEKQQQKKAADTKKKKNVKASK